MSELYDISEVARLFGMSPSGLRFYEEKGLVTPVRTESGRRKYSQRDLQGLMYLTKIHSLGITLDETFAFFHYGNTKDERETGALMRGKVAEVRSQAAYYERLAKYLEMNGSILSNPESYIDKWRIQKVPDYYCLCMTPFFGKGEAMQERLSEWIRIAPMCQTLSIWGFDGNRTVRRCVGYGVERAYADNIGLPFRDVAQILPSAEASVTFVRTLGDDSYGLSSEYMHKLFCEVRLNRGFEKMQSITSIFHVNKKNGQTQKYYQVWVIENRDMKEPPQGE